MQRSRRALLQRRAALEQSILGRNRLYKVSLSLVLFSWGLVFLLSSLISHGNSHQEERHGGTEPTDALGVASSKSTWHDQMENKGSHSENSLDLRKTGSDADDHATLSSGGDTIGNNELLVAKENEHGLSPSVQYSVPVKNSDLAAKVEESPAKSERLSSVAPPGLDEFKSKVISSKGKPGTGQENSLVHRVEPGGKDYNYASATKGAKVLAFNKEAKGASNILEKDKDKYLRNPCSAEEKFVIIELSEETLVDAIEIANFEHYSSNLKDFELLSSLVYPTDSWVKAGNFTSANVKHEQRFALLEPKWARYLRLNLLSHYGSEFYCTLSVLEVYGVDAVERMLEDLISVQDARISGEPNTEGSPSQEHNFGDDLNSKLRTEVDLDTRKENLSARRDTSKGNGIDPVLDSWATQGGRIPGDTVLKILMQKVQQLDLNLSILEQYLEELNSRYGHIFKDFDKGIAEIELLLEHIRVELKNVQNSRDGFIKDIRELLSWKFLASLQLETLVRDNAVLRSEVESIRANQVDMEKRILAVVFTSFFFGSFAFLKLFTDTLLSMCRIHKYEKFCGLSSAWFALLLSSSIIALILVL